PEEQRVDVEELQERQEDRHEDDDDLGPLERPAQDEDDDLGQDHEAERRQVHRQHEFLDRLMAAEVGKDRGECERADKQPAHHGGGAGGQEDGFFQLGELEGITRQHDEDYYANKNQSGNEEGPRQ